ncbi:MAG: hypothetical protein U1E17_14810 [Geminicoccaceae bacterium]
MRRDLARVYPQLADVAGWRQAWSGRMSYPPQDPVVRELEPGLWLKHRLRGRPQHHDHGRRGTVAALTEGGEDWQLLAGFAPRWVGGSAGRYAAQAIYWRHALQIACAPPGKRANRG